MRSSQSYWLVHLFESEPFSATEVRHLIRPFTCVDDAALEWTAADADRLQTMHRLRGLGFSTTSMMARPSSPFPVLRKHAPGRYPDILRW